MVKPPGIQGFQGFSSGEFAWEAMAIFRVVQTAEGPSGWSVMDGEGVTVTEIQGYLDHVGALAFSKHTLRSYAFDLLVFWRWLADTGRGVWSVGTSDLLEYIRWEKERRNPQHPGAGGKVRRIEDGRADGMSVLTINRRLAAIHGLYEHLMAKEPERIQRNPVPRRQVVRSWQCRGRSRGLLGHLQRRVTENALRLRLPKRLPRALTPIEVERLVGSFRTYRDKAMALLMLYGGLRASEVLALKIRDVDLGVRTVRVWGKGGRERVVPVHEDVLRMVHRYLLRERPDSDRPELFLVNKGPHRGLPLTAEGLRRVFRYHRSQADVLAGNPHQLRHTYRTNMAQAGVDAHVLRDLMGHTNLDSTLVYVHLTAEHVRAEYDRAVTRLKASETDGNC
jgi:site-specific recombinase XerD